MAILFLEQPIKKISLIDWKPNMLDEENFYYWDQYFLGDPPKENDDRIKYIYEFMNFVRKEKDKIELKVNLNLPL